MSIFKRVIEAVEENNRINDAQWKDWDSVNHILNTYDIEDEGDAPDIAGRVFLECMIRDNGGDKETFLQALDCIEYGYAFARK